MKARTKVWTKAGMKAGMARHGSLLVLLAVVLVQSVVVARVFTPRPHTGGDNAGYVALAHSLLHRSAYLELWDPAEPPHTKYPPVFPVLLAGAMVLGARGWVGLKLVPALSMVLAVTFAFLWAKERRGLAFGLVIAVLFGLSEATVYYSSWILSDPTFLALTFASLWAFHRAFAGPGASSATRSSPGRAGSPAPGSPSNSPAPEDPSGPSPGASPPSIPRTAPGLWLGLGLAAASLAYLTRSAGIPLLVSVLLWLALKRRWKALLVSALALGLPALLWWLRGTLLGGGDYVSEFWLVDPYFPDLGRVGIAELLQRVADNLTAYVGAIIPAGVVGQGRPAMPLLGTVLAALWLVGWLRCLRESFGVAELLTPLYLALILLWPTSWSGDRFALPLFPLMFFYSGVALTWFLKGAGGRVRSLVVVVLAAILALPSAQRWHVSARSAQACREATHQGRAGACFSPAEEEYFTLAGWARANLPDRAVVVTRKPRIFFVLTGLKAEAIPLSLDTGVFFTRAEESGSRYVSIDRLDSMSQYYLFPVLRASPERFCSIGGVGEGDEAWTQLFGILEEEDPLLDDETRAEGPLLCPREMLRATPRSGPPLGPWAIPLLSEARSGDR